MLRNKPTARRAQPSAPAPWQASPLMAYLQAFCDWTLARGLSEQTARLRSWSVQRFIGWADERGIRQPGEVTRPVLQRYQRHLYLQRKADGAPLALSTQIARLTPVMAFFKWLTREGHILSNPAADLELPARVRQLPRHLLSVAQIEHVINQSDVHSPAGLRDRAMLEVLYSSGIRRGELVALQLHQVDTERGTLMVRSGKGRKDRLVPLGERACAWVAKYLRQVRAELLEHHIGLPTHPTGQALFLTDWGAPFTPDQLSMLARRYMQAGGIAHGSCHAFRHACATHMLEGGADIRFIQAMLGHAQLSTTEIYTHVAIEKLKAVHAMSHPARVQRVQTGQQDANGATDGSMPQSEAQDAANAFLADLVADDDD